MEGKVGQKLQVGVVDVGELGRLKDGMPKWIAVVLTGIATIIFAFTVWNVKIFGFFVDQVMYPYFTLGLFVPSVILNTVLTFILMVITNGKVTIIRLYTTDIRPNT